MTTSRFKDFINSTDIVFVNGVYCIQMDVDFNDIEVNFSNRKEAEIAARYLSELAVECNMLNDVRAIVPPKKLEDDIWKPIEKEGGIERVERFDFSFKKKETD